MIGEFIGNNAITFPVGPFVSNSDGLTPVTGLSIGSCDICAIQKQGTTVAVSIGANSWALVSSMGGLYNLTLTSSQCDTLGTIKISIQKSGTCLPYFDDLELVTSAYFNNKYGSLPFAGAAALSSLDVRVSSIGAQVSSNMALFGTLPTSQTLNAQILTLPNSSMWAVRNSSLDTRIGSLDTRVSANATAVASLDVRVSSIGAAVSSLGLSSTGMTSADLAALFATLPNSATFATRISSLDDSFDVRVQSATWLTMDAIGATAGITSSDLSSIFLAPINTAISSLHARVSSEAAQVNSVYGLGVTFPTSAMVRAQITSLDARVTSADARVATLPTSATMNAQFATLPNSSVLFTQFATLPNSLTLATVVGSLNVRVSSVSAQIASVDNKLDLARGDISSNYAITQTLPSSSMMYSQVFSLDVRVSSVAVQVTSIEAATGITAADVWTYAGSEGRTLTSLGEGGAATPAEVQSACATVVEAYALNTLMNSSTLFSRFSTFPTSLTISGLFATLPTSAMINNQYNTLPTSQTLNAFGASLPNSQAVFSMVFSLDLRVSSLNVRVGSLDTRVVNLSGSVSSNTAILGTLPSSSMFFDRISSLDTRVSSIGSEVHSLALGGATPQSIWTYAGSEGRTLTSLGEGGAATPAEVQSACAQVVADYSLGTFMNSSDLSARFGTLPNSAVIAAYMATLPTSECMRLEFSVLPNSATLFSNIVTLPTSSAFSRAISSLDTRISSLNDLSLANVTSGMFGYTLENSLTMLQTMRVMKSFLAGITSGGGTSEIVFRDHQNLKSRITMAVDSYGNRSSVVLDGD